MVKKVQAHLEKRGLTSKTIEQFRLGYSLKQTGFFVEAGSRLWEKKLRSCGSRVYLLIQNRDILIVLEEESCLVLADASGKIIAFAGRVFESDEQAKYVNSPETPIYNKSRILYGLHESKQAIRQKRFRYCGGRLP